MALAEQIAPFLWGAGGSKKTPEQVAREREIAAALMQGGADYSPVDHWLQGAARAAQGGVGALKGRWADEAETAGREGFQSQWDSVFGGQAAAIDPVAEALVGAPQTATDAIAALASVPSGDQAGYIREGLISRGLPEHVADAFVMNFQDESGLNPGINEANPTVPGSRGGFGLYQLTGPRRVAYEQYAAQKGIDPSNVDAQLDFMMSELQGPEAAAAQSILSAPDTGTAAAAIVNDFLRPAEEHRARRVAQYTGGAPQVAQAGGPDMAALLGLASDPWASDSQKSIIQSLLGQQIEQQDPRYQQQLALGDMQLQQGQLELEQLLNPGQGPMFEGTGMEAQAWNILQSADPTSQEYATAYSIIAQPKPQMVQTENGMMLVPVAPQLPAWLVPPGAAPAPAPAAAPAQLAPLAPQGQSQADPAIFGGPPQTAPAMPVAPANTMAGPGQLIPGTRKPSTEVELRNEMLGTVLTSDLETINDSFDALSDPNGQLLSKLPGGIGNIWQSEEYQQAANAVSSSVANILYSVSGASANPGETENQIRNLTPQLGDKPGTIADKKRRLNVFVNAVANASGNPELIAQARAESLRGMEPSSSVDPTAPASIDALLEKYQ